MIPFVLKSMLDRKVIDVGEGVMIGQRALIGGGGNGTVTIGKTITVTRETN